MNATNTPAAVSECAKNTCTVTYTHTNNGAVTSRTVTYDIDRLHTVSDGEYAVSDDHTPFATA